jgi:hypothetical protein
MRSDTARFFPKKAGKGLLHVTDPRVSSGDYERLKNSIKEEDGLLMPSAYHPKGLGNSLLSMSVYYQPL